MTPSTELAYFKCYLGGRFIDSVWAADEVDAQDQCRDLLNEPDANISAVRCTPGS